MVLYLQLCFRRAGDIPNAKLCQAEHQAVQARRSQDQHAANQHYLQAAQLYKDVRRCGVTAAALLSIVSCRNTCTAF
jgi:hypothetical protein